VDRATREKDSRDKLALEACTFEPQLYTVPVKKFEGSAANLNEKYTLSHIQRVEKARLEKSNGSSGDIRKKVVSIAPPASPPGTKGGNQMDGSESEVNHRTFGDTMKAFQSYIEPSDEDESIIEMLDRERREWHKERMQFVQCIQLQQVELEQRAAAAQERAAEIAKEFARAIGGFEERLCAVEDNVQKEIMGLKNIADSLKVSTPVVTHQLVKNLEAKMDTMLAKMDRK
jgi:hypothetical protein